MEKHAVWWWFAPQCNCCVVARKQTPFCPRNCCVLSCGFFVYLSYWSAIFWNADKQRGFERFRCCFHNVRFSCKTWRPENLLKSLYTKAFWEVLRKMKKHALSCSFSMDILSWKTIRNTSVYRTFKISVILRKQPPKSVTPKSVTPKSVTPKSVTYILRIYKIT